MKNLYYGLDGDDRIYLSTSPIRDNWKFEVSDDAFNEVEKALQTIETYNEIAEIYYADECKTYLASIKQTAIQKCADCLSNKSGRCFNQHISVTFVDDKMVQEDIWPAIECKYYKKKGN